MYHNFFTHSSADGLLGCFCVLDVVNNAAMNPAWKRSKTLTLCR